MVVKLKCHSIDPVEVTQRSWLAIVLRSLMAPEVEARLSLNLPNVYTRHNLECFCLMTLAKCVSTYPRLAWLWPYNQQVGSTWGFGHTQKDSEGNDASVLQWWCFAYYAKQQTLTSWGSPPYYLFFSSPEWRGSVSMGCIWLNLWPWWIDTGKKMWGFP